MAVRMLMQYKQHTHCECKYSICWILNGNVYSRLSKLGLFTYEDEGVCSAPLAEREKRPMTRKEIDYREV
jgi:hypothetical protein